MKRIYRIFLIFTALAVLLSAAAGCGGEKESIETGELDLIHEEEFGGIYLKMTIDDFNALGFEYGDSVDVVFSNGYTLEDIPYYNGYYVEAGSPLLVAYPGYDYIKAAVNYGDDLWDTGMLYAGKPVSVVSLWAEAKLEAHCKGKVILREKGKYRDIQISSDIHYTDVRTDYPSDEVFANFREVTCGDISEGVLYRSASPCDNRHERAPYVDGLMKEAGVKTILDLADTKEKIGSYIMMDSFPSVYFLEVWEKEGVIPLGLDMNFYSDSFRAKLADGLTVMAGKEGPYLVHCTEGKDRTGFVMMVLEALCGAGYEEIRDDYMLTYQNYYKITKETEPEKYDIILSRNLDAMIRAVVGDESVDIYTADLSGYARDYLVASGMSPEDVEALRDALTGESGQ